MNVLTMFSIVTIIIAADLFSNSILNKIVEATTIQNKRPSYAAVLQFQNSTQNVQNTVNQNLYDRASDGVHNNEELVNDQELRDFSETLLNNDVNNAAKYVTVNYQGKTTSRSDNDMAPQPLLSINRQAYNIPTIEKLLPLHNNYILQANANEDNTVQEKNEEDSLLNVIISTPIMQLTKDFLIQKGKLTRESQAFENLLKQIWFNMYSRKGGKLGSSGFEHIFLAELKNNQVSGLHNWIYFHEEENKGRANYLGYLKKVNFGDKGAILKFHFKFNGVDKPVGSMFIGSSPELEMALYTICFALRPDRVCPLQLGGKRFIIRTYTYHYRGKNLIGSAFPEI